MPTRLPVLVAAVAALVPSLAQSPSAQAIHAAARDGLIVRFKHGATAAHRAEAFGRVRGRLRAHFQHLSLDHVTLPAGTDPVAAAAAIAADPAVAYAEPNYVRRIVASGPNDPAWQDASLWGLTKIQAPQAWSAFPPAGHDVVVAVIDTGVNYTHPDLAANIWTNPGEIPGNGLDDDHDGYVDDVHGIDTVNGDADPMDDNGHGTHTAGTIGALGNNGVGVVGVAWNPQLLACKFLDASGSGSDANAIACFDYIIDLKQHHGVNVRVTNNSWGGSRDPGAPFPQALKDAIDAAGAAGIVNVFAAGNGSANTDAAPFDPASLRAASAISVGASDAADGRATFSNYGAQTVDLAAPGVNIYSTYGSSYGYMSGTSMAAPHVTGAIALMASHDPGLSAEALKAHLLDSADPVAPWRGLSTTGGRLDVYAALTGSTENAPPAVSLTSPAAGATVAASTAVTLSATASDPDGSVTRVEFRANGGSLGVVTAPPFSMTWTPSAGTYTLTAIATDNMGAAATSASVTITVTSAAQTGGSPSTPLPAPWTNADVGTTGAAGSASYSGATFGVTGAGADVWGASDAFQYAYQALEGDGSIVARVVSVQNVANWTKAGVMIRGSLSPASAQAFMLVSWGKGVAFQRRPADGGSSVSTAGTMSAAPRWVRLTRRGNTITASESPDGTTWTDVATDTIALGASAYVGLAVSSHVNGTLATATFDHVAVNGWKDADVGGVPYAGRSTSANGTVQVTGSGADVWGTSDQFHYRYRTLSGDGSIVAQVTSIENVASWVKAGVMVRETLDPASAHAFALVSAAKGIAFQRREAAGGVSANTPGSLSAAPRWVKLTRAGNVFSAYESADGATWTLIGTDTIAMAHDVLVGLAVTSHSTSATATCAFDSVNVQ